ncbi:MAG TPA: peptidoglycan-binding protein, partial [Candidatus Paceibacterota bacterium]|nr:peptidoglycan-binding protein [Candidatus Paceibacterota bacterium]
MRNKFFILLAAIMLSATLGLSSVSAATFERTLSVGSTGPDVSVLQQILKNLGYFTYSAITGYFGPVTQTAVQAFQAAKNIVSSGTPETTGYGVVGPQTRSVLNAIAGTATTTPVAIADSTIFARDLEVGMTGDDVAALQRFLNAHGFLIASAGAGSSGNETNYFGPATQAALIRFQAANNIQPAAGYFGPLTRAKTAELSTAGPTAAGSASSLAAPALITIEKTRSYEIVLSWSAVEGAASYTVERKGDNDASWKVIASGITATTYTDTTVQTDEDYSYIIDAVNAKGAGSPSQAADATARTPKSVR